MEDDIIIRRTTDEEVITRLKKAGVKVIPRLNTGLKFLKYHGTTIEITEPIFKAFKFRNCLECGEGEKFLIFKYVAVCMNCHNFYYVTR